MKWDAAYYLSLLSAAGLLVAVEGGYISGRYAGFVLVGVLLSSLILSMSRRPEINVSDYPGQDVLEANVPGGGLKFRGKHLPERLLGDRAITLLLICAVAWFMWWHHSTTEDLMRKNLEATTENTYVLSLSQAEREKLNIAMPESLRRKLKSRE